MLKHLFSGALAAALMLTAQPAFAIFGGGDGDYSKFCETKTARQTVVMVDDRILVDGNIRWADNMIKLVTASLMPSEPVTVIHLKAEGGASERLWSGCFPNYPDQQLASMTGSLISKDPKKVLEAQQSAFKRDMQNAIGAIILKGQRSQPSVNVDVTALPQKQLVRSIRDAANYFDRSRGHVRAILYSDMLENSDLGNSLKSDAQVAAAAARAIALNLQHAVFYVYGVASTIQGTPTEVLKNFWQPLFTAAVGHMAGFGSDLTLQNSPPVTVARYDTAITVGKEVRNGGLLVLADRDGKMVDTIAVSGAAQRALVKDGTIQCSSDGTCKLEAQFPTSLVTRMTGGGDLGVVEVLKLSGPRERLTGKIGIPDALLDNGAPAEFDVVARIAQ
ncbi:hypothetical protein [Asticcacaulis sp.]|uniref:hypothetical protein n=1 Tax=Asticcacaulis sp. TaxID=1872648 RepID=UPI002629696E|nr:hypothetical protein [Asticcacaulis sp.]